jgi:hypothetical protein
MDPNAKYTPHTISIVVGAVQQFNPVDPQLESAWFQPLILKCVCVR